MATVQEEVKPKRLKVMIKDELPENYIAYVDNGRVRKGEVFTISDAKWTKEEIAEEIENIGDKFHLQPSKKAKVIKEIESKLGKVKAFSEKWMQYAPKDSELSQRVQKGNQQIAEASSGKPSGRVSDSVAV